jgi:hypothetical protein
LAGLPLACNVEGSAWANAALMIVWFFVWCRFDGIEALVLDPAQALVSA